MTSMHDERSATIPNEVSQPPVPDTSRGDRRRVLRWVVALLIAGVVIAGGLWWMLDSAAPQSEYAHPEALASAAWLAEHLDDPSVRVLDGRSMWDPGEQAYQEGHIPGSVYVDVWGDLTDPAGVVPGLIPPKADFEALMGRLGVSNDTTVVVYDDEGGRWVARMWWALRYYGHDDVKLLNGGLENWIREGLPLEQGEIVPLPGLFTAETHPELLATLDDVQQAIERPDVVLIDALPAEDYASGHIPSAVNVPAPDNLDPTTHQLLPPDELAQLWQDVDLQSEQRVITYCGGGYYGSLDLFALHQLGHDDIRLYDGSWLEWESHPNLPVETASGPEPAH